MCGPTSSPPPARPRCGSRTPSPERGARRSRRRRARSRPRRSVRSAPRARPPSRARPRGRVSQHRFHDEAVRPEAPDAVLLGAYGVEPMEIVEMYVGRRAIARADERRSPRAVVDPAALATAPPQRPLRLPAHEAGPGVRLPAVTRRALADRLLRGLPRDPRRPRPARPLEEAALEARRAERRGRRWSREWPKRGLPGRRSLRRRSPGPRRRSLDARCLGRARRPEAVAEPLQEEAAHEQEAADEDEREGPATELSDARS